MKDNAVLAVHGRSTSTKLKLHIVHYIGSPKQWTGCESHAFDFVVVDVAASELITYKLCPMCGDLEAYKRLTKGE